MNEKVKKALKLFESGLIAHNLLLAYFMRILILAGNL